MSVEILILGPKHRQAYFVPYAEAVRLGGGKPVIDWPAAGAFPDDESVRAFLRPYRGVLFPGGEDVDSSRYGEAAHPKLGRISRELDEVQLAVARFIIGNDVPTLAICRGLQILGVAAGGTLYQDLPSQRPSGVLHRIAEPPDHPAHSVEIEAGSLLAGLSGALRFEVNSRHHQAVRLDERAEGIGPLRVVARAPDGVVEGLEDPGRPFLVAVQWHPENLAASDSPALGLFRGFVESGKNP